MAEWRNELMDRLRSGKINTDSDIEDFADEFAISPGEVERHIALVAAAGTPCEGCKHIEVPHSMFPCNHCRRNQDIEDRYELG